MAQPPDHPTTTSRLPPPPAPVARDANPWPMPRQQGDAQQGRAIPPRFQRPTQLPPVAPTGTPSRNPSPAPGRSGINRFVPFAIFLAVLGSIAANAIKAVGRGDGLAALIPLVVVVMVAVGWWRGMRRARRR